jgi:hypothetical protein
MFILIVFKGPVRGTVLGVEIRITRASSRYSRIAAAEVSQISKKFRSRTERSFCLGAMALVFAQKFGFRFGLRVIGWGKP